MASKHCHEARTFSFFWWIHDASFLCSLFQCRLFLPLSASSIPSSSFSIQTQTVGLSPAAGLHGAKAVRFLMPPSDISPSASSLSSSSSHGIASSSSAFVCIVWFFFVPTSRVTSSVPFLLLLLAYSSFCLSASDFSSSYNSAISRFSICALALFPSRMS